MEFKSNYQMNHFQVYITIGIYVTRTFNRNLKMCEVLTTDIFRLTYNAHAHFVRRVCPRGLLYIGCIPCFNITFLKKKEKKEVYRTDRFKINLYFMVFVLVYTTINKTLPVWISKELLIFRKCPTQNEKRLFLKLKPKRMRGETNCKTRYEIKITEYDLLILLKDQYDGCRFLL